ncbi:hypothetical protein TSST111916_12990 [Tsukamurella strandjordii]
MSRIAARSPPRRNAAGIAAAAVCTQVRHCTDSSGAHRTSHSPSSLRSTGVTAPIATNRSTDFATHRR